MSVITEICLQKNKKDRVNIFVDNEFFIGTSLEIVYKFSLKKDMEIDKQFLDDIIFENEKIECLNKGISYCSRNLKTEKQVKDYLFLKGYNSKHIYCALDKLKEYKYIDDALFSMRYIESTAHRQGERLSKHKLINKGIKSDVVERALLDAEIDSFSNCKMIAEKYLKNKQITNENLSKAFRYLMGKGFSYEDVMHVINEFKVED